jgi:hypothetical protein
MAIFLCQQKGVSPLNWGEENEEEDMVMMNHTTCMPNTCITWT